MTSQALTQDRSTAVLAGIGLAIAAYFCFSSQDALIKWLVDGASVWQILFMRSLTIFVLSIASGRGKVIRAVARTPTFRGLILRASLMLSAWLLFYNAARELPLADLETLYFAAPLIVTLLAAPLLGERVGLVRWGATLLGFGGVVVACAAEASGVSLAAGMALAAAALWALSYVLLRRISEAETTQVQMVVINGFFLIACGMALPWVWTPVAPSHLALMGLIGVVGGGGQFLLYESVRRAPASVLAPFEYTALLWAFLYSYAIWNHEPSSNVVVGALMIVASGLVVFLREVRDMRRPIG